jgi:hypothetical protein
MPRKKSEKKLKQTRIEGTFDPIPQPVQLAADQYVEAKREVASWRAEMNGRRDHLISTMREYEINEILIDDEEKRIILSQEDKIRIGARKERQEGEEAA